MDIAFKAEFNFKAARYDTHGHAQSSLDRAEPMDLSHADDGEAELQAVEQQRNIHRYQLAKVQEILVLIAHCVIYDRLGRAVTPPQTRNLARCGKT